MSLNEKVPMNFSGGSLVHEVPPYSEKKSSSPSHNRSSSNSKADRMFKSNSWRDLWAAILYYVHLAGVAVILGLNFKNLSKFESVATDTSKIIQSLGIIGSSLVLCVLLLTIFLTLVNKFPKTMIKGTFISTIILLGLMGVGMFFVPGGAFMGLMYLIMAGLNVILYFSWRNRIPFSATLLKTVVDVMKIYPNTWNLSIFAILSQAAFTVLYVVTLTAISLKYSDKFNSRRNDQVEGIDIAALLYVVFSMYWSMQVVENVVHTSVCGVFATFYFLHGTGAAIMNPVWNSFSRSMTYSFGSIAFGSLIVAILQFVRFLINSTRNERDNLAAACASYLVEMIEGLVRFFNHYAYVHVAIYGKPFIESGKDTWELIKSHGVDVIINDSLVGTCMNIAIFLISLTCCLFAFIAGLTFLDSLALQITTTVLTFVFVTLISVVATQLIESGVSATLVCYAEDPTALQRSKPELYREITHAYQQSFF